MTANQSGIPVDLQEDGALWAINAALFHPRGFALGVRADNSLVLFGDGTEPWHYALPNELEDPAKAIDQDAKFQAFEALLDRAKQA